MARLRAAAMKIWVRSWHTPRLSANASAAVVVAWVGALSNVISSCSRSSRSCRIFSGSSPARRESAGEFRDRRVEPRQRRLAQIKARRKPLDRADHHAAGVLGVDLAVHQHAQLRQRALGAEHMGDVAEGILVLVELAIFRHVDAPAFDILAVVIARRQPQRLDHAARRLLVAIDGLVRNLDAHGHGRSIPIASGLLSKCAQDGG